MPTYEYYCKACDEQFEVLQRITEPPLTECKHCGGPVRKLISPVGVIFKGSGFHINDYRKPEAKKEPDATPKSEPKTESASTAKAA
ncbi:MAG: hypothetical protein HY321_01745 [Armatimonadetes bacterium]|nr:hypothetical protein [Armatimonadota bacterium]